MRTSKGRPAVGRELEADDRFAAINARDKSPHSKTVWALELFDVALDDEDLLLPQLVLEAFLHRGCWESTDLGSVRTTGPSSFRRGVSRYAADS